MLRAGEWKAITERTWEKSWNCKRHKAPVLWRGEEEWWATIENSLHHRKYTCLPASREQHFPVHSLPPSPTHASDLRVPAIPEGWTHNLWEAEHHKGFPFPFLPNLWRGYTPA